VKLHLPSYNKAVHQIDEVLDPAELDLNPDEFQNPVKLHVVLDRHDPYLDCKFQVSADIRTLCDRCLEAYDSTVVAAAPMLYVLGPKPEGGDVDDTDLQYIPASTTDLDISADIRDLLILQSSGKHLCKEDCRGICPNCGANLNIENCTCSQQF
jgi:uncharacterized protein